MPLAFALSIKLYNVALALAPRDVLLNSQFLRPTTTGLMARSARLLSMAIRHLLDSE